MQWDGVHALVQRVRAGDRQAWDQLDVYVHPYLLGLAGRILGPGWPERSVDDLVQKTKLRAWEKRAQFKGGDDDAQTGALLRAWLAKVMRNLHRNAQRKPQPKATARVDTGGGGDSTGHETGVQPAATDLTASSILRRREECDLIQDALAKLDESDRQLVQWKFFDNWSYRQVGKQLGLDESTVRYRLDGILERLGIDLKGLQ